MHCAKFPKKMVADFFKIGLSTPEVVSFKSGYMLHKVLDTMVETAPWKRGEVDFQLQKELSSIAEILLHVHSICVNSLHSMAT